MLKISLINGIRVEVFVKVYCQRLEIESWWFSLEGVVDLSECGYYEVLPWNLLNFGRKYLQKLQRLKFKSSL
jgi:hypothetical protein